MKINEKLLKSKIFNPLQKLILGLILDVPSIVIQYQGGYDKTCGDMAKELGTTRNKILIEMGPLIENGFVASKVSYRSRVSNITQKFKDLFND